MQVHRQPMRPPGSGPPAESARLSARVGGLVGGLVILIGSASLDLLRALAGSASRIVLMGTDPIALQLQRRALLEDRVEEVDSVLARTASIPIRSAAAGGVLLATDASAAATAEEVHRELERITGKGPVLALMGVDAVRATKGELLAADQGLALFHIAGRRPGAQSTDRRSTAPVRRRASAHDPRVSVVIPTRNRSRLLVRALDSAITQDVQPHEIVVVDDGSTDDTESVIARWRAAHAGDRAVAFQSLRGEAAGQGAAMNAGLAAASGDWIAWLDDDDYFLPAKLRLQLRTLDDPRVGLAVTAHYIGNDNGEPREVRSLPRFADDEVLRLLLRGSIFLGPTAIVRRSAYDELGDRPYDATLARAADYALWWQLARRWRVAVLQVPLTVVCRHAGNALDLGRARAIYDSVRRTLRWVKETIPLGEIAGARASMTDIQLERAAALLRAGLWEEARGDLEALREAEPDRPDGAHRADNFLALADLESGDWPAAETRFEAVLRRAPANREALNGLATVLLLADRRADARRILARARHAHPHDPLSRYNEALAAEASPTEPGPALTLARDLLAERGLSAAVFSAAPPLSGIDAYFTALRREGWRRDATTSRKGSEPRAQGEPM